MLVNRTKVKEIAGSMQLSKEFLEELENATTEHIRKACKRATANSRTTLMARDL
ncbi:MAG: hypothetical protein ACMXYE_03265 [Candidatus Woesearchaeota archaeon]